MTRGRSQKLAAQGAAFVALLAIVLALLAQLREESPHAVSPVAATGSAPSAAQPAKVGPLLPPPAPPTSSATPLASAASAPGPANGRGRGGASGSSGGDEDPDKPIRAHAYLVDARGKRIAGALVNAKNRRGIKLRPRRSTKEGDVLFDPVRPSDGPLDVTVRHARWGKQTFVVSVRLGDQVLHLDTPRRGPLTGKVRATDGSAPRGVVLALIDSFGTISELDEDVRFLPDGSFATEVVPGNYRVRATAPGFCPSEWERAVVALEAPGTVELVVLRASKISGTITSAANERENRTVDVELELNGPEGLVSTTRKVKIDASGAYELDKIRPGWYRMRACDAKRDGAWFTTQIAEGVPSENMTLFLDGERRDAAVEGVVKDAAETPLPAVTVWSQSHRTVTDDYGHFLLHLDPSQEKKLTIEKEGYETQFEDLVLEPGSKDPKGVQVTLEPLD